MKYAAIFCFFITFQAAQAGGLIELLNDYSTAAENRMALQAVAERGGEVQDALSESYQAEEHLASEILLILDAGDDISEVLMGYLVEQTDSRKLSVFSRFFDGTDRGQSGARIMNKINAVSESGVEKLDAALPYVVGSTGACLMQEPDFQSGSMALLQAGTRVSVRGISGNFYLVDLNGTAGYLPDSLVNLDDDSQTAVKDGSRGSQGTVTAASLNVRKGPGTSYEIVDCLASGATVPIQESSNGWCKVTTPKGITGWVSKSYLNISDDSSNNDNNHTDVVPEGDIPANVSQFTKLSNQDPTYYCSTREKGFPTSGTLYGVSYNGSEKKDILTPSGSKIATTSGRWFACLCMQGSGIMKDDRCATWAGNKRFNLAPNGCKGITATGYWVVSFHTMAVNKNQMPYKGVYFIPKSRGLKLPNGETHDGFWFAHDTGGAFVNANNRIDLYADMDEWVTWMENNCAQSHSKVEVYRVDNATKDKVYAKYKDFLGKQ
ncbi:MAG: SH3 domain-containing protein [Candidatus Wallbacteria bacterium]|nr:SH3 domain-containing protein [Candidatus Wallbacteria bacterium]